MSFLGKKILSLYTWFLELWAVFLTFLKRKQKEKLTIMLVPHSEKQLISFKISVLNINIVLIIFSLVIIISSITIIGRSGAKHEIRELQLSNTDYKRQRKKIRQEIKPIHDIIREFTTTTGLLLANSGGPAFDADDAIGGPETDSEFWDKDESKENSNAVESKSDNPKKDNSKNVENSDDKNSISEKSLSTPEFYLPPEISILKQDIHNLELTMEWGRKAIELIKKQKIIIKYTPSIWPAKGHIALPFGPVIDPYTGGRIFNRGMDIGALPGSKVRATADGIVDRVYNHPKYGYSIDIKHRWGFKTIYGYLERVTIAVETKIKKGDTIGFVGKSGFIDDYMLHYEIWVGTEYINPYPFINRLAD